MVRARLAALAISRHLITGFTIALGLVVPAAAAAPPGGQGQGKPTDGARTLGDPLLPQIGNGGYDVDHYRIYLDYDPVANEFDSAKTTIDATADAKLKQFSLDFQAARRLQGDGRRA